VRSKWHTEHPKDVTYTLRDDAELAIRLGALSSIDRMGEVIFYDNFSDGLCHWTVSKENSGTEVNEDGTVADTGGWSIKFYLPTGIINQIRLYRIKPLPYTFRIGFEFAVSLASLCEGMIFRLRFYTGTEAIYFGINLNVANNRIEYQDEDGNFTTFISDVFFYISTSFFHKYKFVVDFNTLEYVRLRAMDTTYSMSGLKPYIFNSALNPHLFVEIWGIGSDSGSITTYLDSIILTQNEP